MTFSIITLFPSMFLRFREASLIGSAVRRNLIGIDLVDLRNFGIGKHRNVDDTPYGGGSGMLIRPEPVVAAIESVIDFTRYRKIILSPSGTVFNQKKAAELAQRQHIMFVCGRYEGLDCRIGQFTDEEISIGDFVTMGGEVAAMAMIESISRLVPGVLGNRESLTDESCSDEFPVEYDQYTKPLEYRGMNVPGVLTSGNHKKIAEWRFQNAGQKYSDTRKHT